MVAAPREGSSGTNLPTGLFRKSIDRHSKLSASGTSVSLKVVPRSASTEAFITWTRTTSELNGHSLAVEGCAICSCKHISIHAGGYEYSRKAVAEVSVCQRGL